ncbi:hypothetical protein TcBrA4_0011760 [Trypanosoma cruzi]|nr:hypothetical protein TcBrA4_0011760 [Trypanosoma cruzi]
MGRFARAGGGRREKAASAVFLAAAGGAYRGRLAWAIAGRNVFAAPCAAPARVAWVRAPLLRCAVARRRLMRGGCRRAVPVVSGRVFSPLAWLRLCFFVCGSRTGGRRSLAFAHDPPARKNATARDSRVLMPGPTRCQSGAGRRAGDGVLGPCGVWRAGRGACRTNPAHERSRHGHRRLSWDGVRL